MILPTMILPIFLARSPVSMILPRHDSAAVPYTWFTLQVYASNLNNPQQNQGCLRVYGLKELDEWETPRLCRGGSRSLTAPGVT